ncbi:hypothetical protein KJP29_01640 [Maritimibacter sp. DP1N21-5]|nr:hypothetical protein [Maritimibacter sp. DP1N21-5]
MPSVPPDFDRLLTRIGYLNYAWTNTESLLIHVLAGLLDAARPSAKETATIIHLTLNTTRARIDLIERLAKREGNPLPKEAIDRILKLTHDMKRLSGIRNQLNHSLYAFDANQGIMRSIQMKIADRKSGLKYGQEKPLGRESVEELDEVLSQIRAANAALWSVILDYDLPA